MTELTVGTKKGLFVLEGEPGGEFEVRCRAFAGEPVDFAMRDPASGRLVATSTSPFYGPKIWFADDPAGEWIQAEGVALPEGGEHAQPTVIGAGGTLVEHEIEVDVEQARGVFGALEIAAHPVQ